MYSESCGTKSKLLKRDDRDVVASWNGDAQRYITMIYYDMLSWCTLICSDSRCKLQLCHLEFSQVSVKFLCTFPLTSNVWPHFCHDFCWGIQHGGAWGTHAARRPWVMRAIRNSTSVCHVTSRLMPENNPKRFKDRRPRSCGCASLAWLVDCGYQTLGISGLWAFVSRVGKRTYLGASAQTRLAPTTPHSGLHKLHSHRW